MQIFIKIFLVFFLQHDSELWKIVFNVVVAVLLLANILFILFGEVAVQSWNEPRDQNESEIELGLERFY